MGGTLYPLFVDFLFCCCLGLMSPWCLGHWMWGASLDLSSASPGSVAKLLPLSPFLPFCRIVLASARCSLVASAPAARLLELEGDSTAGGGTGPFCFLAVALRVTLAMALCLSSGGCLTSSSLHTPRTTLCRGTCASQSGALLPVIMSSVAQTSSSGLSQFSHPCLTHSSSDILCQNECSFCFSDRTFSTGSSFNWS